MTTLHSLQLRTLTGFYFTHEWKHRLESFLLTIFTKIFLLVSTFPSNSLNDHNPHFLITVCITIRDEHDALFDYNTVRSRFTENTFYI